MFNSSTRRWNRKIPWCKPTADFIFLVPYSLRLQPCWSGTYDIHFVSTRSRGKKSSLNPVHKYIISTPAKIKLRMTSWVTKITKAIFGPYLVDGQKISTISPSKYRLSFCNKTGLKTTKCCHMGTSDVKGDCL